MKNLLLFIFIFISQLSFAQEKNNQEIEIVFKPKSTKLSKVEKEKIRKFVEENPLDSNEVYCVMEYDKIVHRNFKLTQLLRRKILKNYARAFVIIEEIGKNHKNTYKIDYSFLGYRNNNDTLKIKIKPYFRGCDPPPFPNLKK